MSQATLTTILYTLSMNSQDTIPIFAKSSSSPLNNKPFLQNEAGPSLSNNQVSLKWGSYSSPLGHSMFIPNSLPLFVSYTQAGLFSTNQIIRLHLIFKPLNFYCICRYTLFKFILFHPIPLLPLPKYLSFPFSTLKTHIVCKFPQELLKMF